MFSLPLSRTSSFRSRRRFLAIVALAFGSFAAASGALAQGEQGADKIVVSGASGGLAGEAIQELIGRGIPLTELILVTRTPEKLSSLCDQRR